MKNITIYFLAIIIAIFISLLLLKICYSCPIDDPQYQVWVYHSYIEPHIKNGKILWHGTAKMTHTGKDCYYCNLLVGSVRDMPISEKITEAK